MILAAGEGSRLRPFTEDMPKVMLPVANRPILEYVIEALCENGINEIIIVVGYRKESIMSYFGAGEDWKVNIKYVTQEKQLGTGHALLRASDLIRGNEFLVLPGDNIIDKNSISKLIKSSSPVLIVEESKIPSKYGVVEMEKNIVKKLVEKPTAAESNIISTGIYKFKRNIFEMVEECIKEGKNSLTEAVQNMMERERIYTVRGNGKWKDVVYPWNLIEMNADALMEIKAEISGKIEKNVVVRGNVIIGKDTVIHPNSYIKGPVIIGEGCEIGPHACIFPSTSIGNNVVIHPFTEIRNSIIMDGVSIGSSSLVSDSVIGQGVKIFSHFSTINGRAIIKIENEFHEIVKVGAFIGSGCTIGANVVMEPGVIVGGSCNINPQKIISGNVPSMSRVV